VSDLKGEPIIGIGGHPGFTTPFVKYLPSCRIEADLLKASHGLGHNFSNPPAKLDARSRSGSRDCRRTEAAAGNEDRL